MRLHPRTTEEYRQRRVDESELRPDDVLGDDQHLVRDENREQDHAEREPTPARVQHREPVRAEGRGEGGTDGADDRDEGRVEEPCCDRCASEDLRVVLPLRLRWEEGEGPGGDLRWRLQRRAELPDEGEQEEEREEGKRGIDRYPTWRDHRDRPSAISCHRRPIAWTA